MRRNRLRTAIAAGIGWMALAGAARAADTSASVSGQVLDGSGNPAPGVIVMMTRKSLSPGETNPGALTAITGSDGAYRIGPAGAAEYNLCVFDDAQRFVASCIWNAPIAVNLAAGESRTGVDLRVEEGVEVSFDDPGQSLSAKNGQATYTALVGIGGGHMFVPVNPKTDAAGKRHYTLLIPYGRNISIPISLFVQVQRGAAAK